VNLFESLGERLWGAAYANVIICSDYFITGPEPRQRADGYVIITTGGVARQDVSVEPGRMLAFARLSRLIRRISAK